MKIGIVAYQVFLLASYAVLFVLFRCVELPQYIVNFSVPLFCAIAGGFGGSVYCLRGVYLHACAQKNWDPAWYPWYFIRPIVSLCCGLVSYIFLKTGLLVLNANIGQETNLLGFYALAFIAGYNADMFLKKIEEIAQGIWNINPSRASRNGERKEG